jgi:hypothetical protein
MRQVFIRVYRLEISSFLRTFSHVDIFNPAALLGSVEDHILQEFYNLYLPRFRTYKIARPPKQNLGGEGASDRYTVPSAKSLNR